MAPSGSTPLQRLDWLFSEGRIAPQRGDLFGTVPSTLGIPRSWDRVEGMLLGLAIGDSLGNTTESHTPEMRRALHGEVRGYLPNPYAGGHFVGTPSDDTQLAFWTLEHLLEDEGLVPEHLAERFCREPLFGIGRTVSAFRERVRAGVPWHEAGPRSAGNGALMRIAPVLVPHLKTATPALWADTAVAAMVTHNDPASTGSCLAFVRLLWEALSLAEPPEPEWWLETFCSTLAPLEGETQYRTLLGREPYEGPLWRFTQTRVVKALEQGLSVEKACESWGSSAYLLETVPSVLYVLCRHGQDPEEAIVRAVNDTWDNGTIGALVGAAVGALHGKSRLPEPWVKGLLGRTGLSDDGHVFELVGAARRRWWER